MKNFCSRPFTEMHFEENGGRAIFLGTGFGNIAFRLYENFGFEPVEPKSGYMVRFFVSNFCPRCLAEVKAASASAAHPSRREPMESEFHLARALPDHRLANRCSRYQRCTHRATCPGPQRQPSYRIRPGRSSSLPDRAAR